MQVSEKFKKALWVYVIEASRRGLDGDVGKFKQKLVEAKSLADVVGALESFIPLNEQIIIVLGKANDWVGMSDYIANLKEEAPLWADDPPFSMDFNAPPEKKPAKPKK